VRSRGVSGERGEQSRNDGKVPDAVTTTVLISVVISVAITLALLLLVLLTRGEPRAPAGQDAIGGLVEDLTSRMEAMSRELNEALERTREESRRNLALGELAGTIDLDEVLNRTLDAASRLPNVDAALINVLGPTDEPVTTAVGITPEEAEAYSVGRVPAGRRIRSLVLDYGGGPERPSPTPAVRAGLAVPIQGEDETLGLLTVFSRTAPRAFDEDLRTEIETLARRAGPAIDNARRFREARHQADVDELTGLHTRRYFYETLAREIARAQRYNRRLALVVFDLDDFKAINDRSGHLAGDAVLSAVAERVRDVVRHSDIGCRVGGDEFAVVLPESTLADARQLYDRILAAVSSRPIGYANGLRLSAGIAELRPEDDSVTFFQRADEALLRAKEAGKGRVAPESEGIGAPPGPPEDFPFLGLPSE
jgi:diguanylate cyclase (GGDEF)-like protein